MKRNAIIYSASFAAALACTSLSLFAQSISFSPLLPQDTVNVPARFPVKGNIGDASISTVPDTSGQWRATAKENSQVFRIQLIPSNQFSEASFARKVAEEIFAVPVEVAYEAPYYKVQIGEFGTREEAERYLPRVQAAGYPNAIVVAAIIGIQKAAPAYDTTDSTADSTEGKQ